jgi:2-oxoglutarate dehydrogenase E2 component (dihydrolipoamide succinyltransferase)
VNAPEAGTIKELLVNEEDTVTVGQDLVRLEVGGAAPEAKNEAAPEQPKESAAEKPKETAAEPEKPKETKPAPPKPAPAKAESPKPAATESKPAVGGREERRVCFDLGIFVPISDLKLTSNFHVNRSR